MKRIRLTVRWDRGDEQWVVRKGSSVLEVFPGKQAAVSYGRRQGRYLWEVEGRTQLTVFTKQGRIAYEATYGHDPRKYPS